jgi:hypothetical protein
VQTLTDNSGRLGETDAWIESVLAELLRFKPDGQDNAEDFRAKKEADYALLDPAPEQSESGIVIPAVPEGCSDETKMAAQALEEFDDGLREKLTFYDYL